MPVSGAFTLDVLPIEAGMRLDSFAAYRHPELSRSHAASLILEGLITVNGKARKPGYRLRAGDRIDGSIPAPVPIQLEPETIRLDIIFEDPSLIVINKAPGMVVHPAPGHFSGTLVNALLHHCPGLQGIGGALRPGIVHRLDKDTSGVMVVAKTAAAQAHLADQFASRTIGKLYQAVVYGCPEADSGIIRLPIGRHPVDRKRMSTIAGGNMRPAETHWFVKERFNGLSLLELNLKTGRTHQARVHCQAMGHPVVGDPVYAGRHCGRSLSPTFKALLKAVDRQMLHAWQLELNHPAAGEKMRFTAPTAPDMAGLIDQLRSYASSRDGSKTAT